jgi:hypothetical protein
MFFGDGTAPSGVRHYVVPIRNGQVAEEPLPERCVRELSGEARERAERRNRRIRDARPAWDICLLAETGSGGCGVGGAPALEERGTIGSSQTSGGASDVVGLVPDGVASVTARYDGFERSVPVTRNFFTYGVDWTPRARSERGSSGAIRRAGSPARFRRADRLGAPTCSPGSWASRSASWAIRLAATGGACGSA